MRSEVEERVAEGLSDAPVPSDPPGSIGALCVGETMSLIAPEEPVGLETAARFTLSAGGAESNVAVHLAGLGHHAAWASRVGDDPLGRRLVADLAAMGVDTRHVETHPSAPTGVYFKDPAPTGTRVHYYRAGSAASTMAEDFLADAVLDRAGIVHLSGITPVLSESCERMISRLLARPRQQVVSFDVNYRSALWSVDRAAGRLRELANQADVVFVGLDEAATLWGCATSADVRALLPTPATVVVKNSDVDVTALGDETVVVPAPRVEVVEPVGAGDAFAAGYLSGVLRGMDVLSRLRLGHLLAAQSLLSTTDHRAAPDGAQLRGWLNCSAEQWRQLRFGSA